MEKEKAAQEMERLRRERGAHAPKDSGISQKTIMVVVLALGVLLIGFWMLAQGSTDAPKGLPENNLLKFVSFAHS